MRVFRPNRTTKSGESKPYAKWYVEFRDHCEKIRRLPGYSDKKQTEELGRKIEKLVACRGNNEAPDVALGRWLESLPGRIRDRLGEIGLLDARRVAAGKPLSKHVDEFEKSLRAKGDTEKHARLVANRIRKVVVGCRFQFWSDLSASRIQCYLADLRNNGEGIAIQTSNFYLQAIKQFCKWMVRDRRASQSPVEHLQGQNVQTDRRHDRRALSVEEMRWLLTVTLEGPKQAGITGAERYLIYRQAVESGLRANEVRTLTRSSFDLDSGEPTVTVLAGYSKRRRKDVLPLRADTVELLRHHLATKLPDAQAFQMPKKDRLAHVLRADLAAAREVWLEAADTPEERKKRERTSFLSYEDESGCVADFQALRHTFITNLANSGTHPKVAQMLARHSTITLTMDRYTHSLWEDLAHAVDRLPDLSLSIVVESRATGTDGRGAPSVALCVAHQEPESRANVRLSAVDDDRRAEEGPAEKPQQTQKNGGSAWESNPPERRLTQLPTVLKTAADTSRASTSEVIS